MYLKFERMHSLCSGLVGIWVNSQLTLFYLKKEQIVRVELTFALLEAVRSTYGKVLTLNDKSFEVISRSKKFNVQVKCSRIELSDNNYCLNLLISTANTNRLVM